MTTFARSAMRCACPGALCISGFTVFFLSAWSFCAGLSYKRCKRRHWWPQTETWISVSCVWKRGPLSGRLLSCKPTPSSWGATRWKTGTPKRNIQYVCLCIGVHIWPTLLVFFQRTNAGSVYQIQILREYSARRLCDSRLKPGK